MSVVLFQPHEFDECRLDISVNDSVWYLRAQDPEHRHQWIDSVELHRVSHAHSEQTAALKRNQILVTFATNTYPLTPGWICVSVCVLIVCMCVFLSDYQRGEEREGRNPGDNIHPSTTGAFVGKFVGLTESFTRL